MMTLRSRDGFHVSLTWTPSTEKALLHLKLRIAASSEFHHENNGVIRFELQLWRGVQLRDRQWIACSIGFINVPQEFDFSVHQSNRHAGARPRLQAVLLLDRRIVHRSDAPVEIALADQQGRFLDDKIDLQDMGERTRLWTDDEFSRLLDE